MQTIKLIGIQGMFSLLILPILLGVVALHSHWEDDPAQPVQASKWQPMSYDEVKALHPDKPQVRKQMVFYLYDSESQIAQAKAAENELDTAARLAGEVSPNRSYDFYNVADPAEERRITRVIGITEAEMAETNGADVIVVDLRPTSDQ